MRKLAAKPMTVARKTVRKPTLPMGSRSDCHRQARRRYVGCVAQKAVFE
jgi:hypothetical protein